MQWRLHPNILAVGLFSISQYTYTCTRLLLEGGQIILSQANSNICINPSESSYVSLSVTTSVDSLNSEVCEGHDPLYSKVIFTLTSYHG